METLFPTLPAELRNEIYSHTMTSSPTSYALPFEAKTWYTKHTTLYLMPVHCGNPSLLDLSEHNYLEGREYNNWVLTKGIEFRGAIRFHGHPHTFIQKHWDADVLRHLRKLAKRFPWVERVAKWDMRVIWRPPGDKDCKQHDRAGAIASGFVAAMTQIVKRDFVKDLDVSVDLHIESGYAFLPVLHAYGPISLGLEGFMKDRVGAKRESRAVVMDVIQKTFEKKTNINGMVIFGPMSNEADNDWMKWDEGTKGILVVRKTVGNGEDKTDYEPQDVVEKLSPGKELTLARLKRQAEGISTLLVN
ncbi:hypothetical protein B0J11DRAFT_71501 [Dendryphion nanum]|uniref:Uncharacterized protein n=1 Tax=Dendryphion nanum TaxID=256645 RepID=A0A9P9IGJ4_9PLEO|nr:hypothetical protein B0J11DRAFT_71501 [Dendryphion nanum]